MITGPWPDRGNITMRDYVVTIPFNHLRPSMVRELLDYAADIGETELHDALSDVATDLGDY